MRKKFPRRHPEPHRVILNLIQDPEISPHGAVMKEKMDTEPSSAWYYVAFMHFYGLTKCH